jgi:hypothetical protein
MRLRLALLGSFAILAVAAPAAQAVVFWAPPEFDFKSQPVGSKTPQKFTLVAQCDANNGFPAFQCVAPANGAHNVGAPTVIGDDFTLLEEENGCASGVLVTPTVAPAVCTLVAEFTPNSPGAKTGTINLPNGPDVALSGTGTAQPQAAKKCKKKKKGKSAAAAKKKKCKKKKK